MKKMYVAILFAFVISMTSQAWTTTQEAADRLGASKVKEVGFDKNSDILSDMQKSDLKTAIAEAAQKGKIDEVKILAWSDKEYPSEKGKLDKGDVNLAKNRIRNLKKFLMDDLNVSTVETHNMTERPNALQKLFNTSDAKVKNTAEAMGAAPTQGNTGFFDLKTQASKAAIMIFMKK